jgi:hypothetical protein
MTKYTSLALTGGSILLSCLALVIIFTYFAITGPKSHEVTTADSPKRDTVIVEKRITLPPDTIVVTRQCKKKHCEEPLAVSSASMSNDSSLKNQTSNGN